MRLPVRLSRLEPRWLAAASVVTVLVLAVAGVGAAVRRNDTARTTLPALVDLSPSAVGRLVVEAGGRQAELTRHARGWSASPGTPPQSAPLLLSTEDELFPMLAYRVVRADPADPQYGLTEPAAVVRLEGRAGTAFSLRVGAASFSGAGFYANHDRDPGHVYLVPRNTVDLLRSLASGERKSSADPVEDRAGRIKAEQDKAARDKGTSTYLRQAIDAGGQMPPAPPTPEPAP
jgi:hypothetical protein